MRSVLGRTFALALSLTLLFSLPLAADTGEKALNEVASFGTLESPSVEVVKQQAADWLKSVGKTDAASTKAFEAIWSTERPVLDKVTKTLVLGDEKAAKLMAEVSKPDAPAPTEVPAVLKDLKVPSFYRANLALAYARQLANRRIYDEALSALRGVKPEQVVNPGAYFFTRAVSEYTLMMKAEADDSILRLLDDVADAPERYRMVAALMHFDMMTWQEKDLGWISRKMNVIKDRLEIARGGKKTQRMQKEVLVRLDEMIKEMENKQKQQGGT